eukprot:1391112-Prymnesium_polylepis.1
MYEDSRPLFRREMIRVSDRRVCYPQYRQDNQLVPESPESPGTSGLTSMHQESTIRMQAPGKYPGTCQSHVERL